jgi:hypothetical protein
MAPQSNTLSDGGGVIVGPMGQLIGMNIGDAIVGLPATAAGRLRGLRERSEEMSALARLNFEVTQALQDDKRQKESRIRNLKQAHADGGHNLPDDDFRVRVEQAKLDSVVAELTRKHELAEARGAENRTLMRLIANCETWIRSRPGNTKIVEYSGKLPKLPEGQDLLDAIETCRRHGREFAAQRHSTECAPFPTTGVQMKYRAEFEALAEIGRLDLTAMLEHGAHEVGWPKEQVRVQIYNSCEPLVGFIEIIDIKAVLAQLIREQLIKAADRECAEAGDDAHALDDKTRAERLAAISSDLLACERIEAAHCWAAQEKGFGILHREDIDARALLGVDCVIAKASPPSDDRSHTTKFLGAPR